MNCRVWNVQQCGLVCSLQAIPFIEVYNNKVNSDNQRNEKRRARGGGGGMWQ